MLAPEVVDFSIPLPNLHFTDKQKPPERFKGDPHFSLDKHYFNHCVSIIIPDTFHVPDEVRQIISSETFYYKLSSVPIHHFVRRDFINEFVRKGELTGLSVGTWLDVDDCCALSPTGILYLSLRMTIFQKLGIEKGPGVLVKKKPERLVQVEIDLKNESFTSSKYYDRVWKQLQLCTELSPDFIIAWDPPENDTACASISEFFTELGVNVTECSLKSKSHISYNVLFPPLSSDKSELNEWMGAFILGLDSDEDPAMKDFLGEYVPPEESENIGQATLYQCRGLISRKKMGKLYDTLSNLATGMKSPYKNFWIGVLVNGFQDSPVTWGSTPNSYRHCGDNFYSILIGPTGRNITFTLDAKQGKT